MHKAWFLSVIESTLRSLGNRPFVDKDHPGLGG